MFYTLVRQGAVEDSLSELLLLLGGELLQLDQELLQGVALLEPEVLLQGRRHARCLGLGVLIHGIISFLLFGWLNSGQRSLKVHEGFSLTLYRYMNLPI